MEIPTISAHRALRSQHVSLLFQSRAWVGKLFLGWPSWYPEPSFPKAPICNAVSTKAPPSPGRLHHLCRTGHRHCPSNTPDLHLLLMVSVLLLLLINSFPSLLSFLFVLPSLAESDIFSGRQCKGTVGISHTNLYLQKLSCHPGM